MGVGRHFPFNYEHGYKHLGYLTPCLLKCLVCHKSFPFRELLLFAKGLSNQSMASMSISLSTAARQPKKTNDCLCWRALQNRLPQRVRATPHSLLRTNRLLQNTLYAWTFKSTFTICHSKTFALKSNVIHRTTSSPAEIINCWRTFRWSS